MAPAARRASVAANRVAPVVHTSSTTMTAPGMLAPANAVSECLMLPMRPVRPSFRWSRLRAATSRGAKSSPAMNDNSRARCSAWSTPRRRRAAAVAAVGFGAVSDPPMRAFPRIALLAAVGHALRFCLMNCAGMDIATASLCAATAIGFGSLWLGKAIRCPMTALYIPALLPMVPGIYAYKTVFSLIMFLQSLNDPGQGMQYMQLFFLNATVSLSVIALLAAGATLPIFVFNRRAFSLTRRRKNVK